MRDKYIEECKTIGQNCTYTAETHYDLAKSAKLQAILFQVVPAVCAAVTSAFVAAGASTNLLPITILSATISAVASVLNPNRAYEEHLSAARAFTALRHDARFLAEATSTRMSDDAFAVAVENLHERYNDVLKSTPPTTKKAFERARVRVQSGVHEPDRDKKGRIK
jgi:hypothetical protein